MANQEIEIVLCEPDMSWLVEGWNDMFQTNDKNDMEGMYYL